MSVDSARNINGRPMSFVEDRRTHAQHHSLSVDGGRGRRPPSPNSRQLRSSPLPAGEDRDRHQHTLRSSPLPTNDDLQRQQTLRASPLPMAEDRKSSQTLRASPLPMIIDSHPRTVSPSGFVEDGQPRLSIDRPLSPSTFVEDPHPQRVATSPLPMIIGGHPRDSVRERNTIDVVRENKRSSEIQEPERPLSAPNENDNERKRKHEDDPGQMHKVNGMPPEKLAKRRSNDDVSSSAGLHSRNSPLSSARLPSLPPSAPHYKEPPPPLPKASNQHYPPPMQRTQWVTSGIGPPLDNGPGGVKGAADGVFRHMQVQGPPLLTPQPTSFGSNTPVVSEVPKPEKEEKKEEPPKPKHLSFKHLNLLYETGKDNYICRECRENRSSTKFPLSAPLPTVFEHSLKEHSERCEDLLKFSPAKLAEEGLLLKGGGGRGGPNAPGGPGGGSKAAARKEREREKKEERQREREEKEKEKEVGSA